jgi:hypothetical protein
MRTRLTPATFVRLAATVVLLVSAPVSAQTFTPTASPSFLVTGVAPGAQSQPSSSEGGGGIGFGVKGGYLYSSIAGGSQPFDNNNGWEVGVFLGGNRNGVVGVMGEVMYAKKAYKAGDTNLNLNSDLDLYYVEIPVLARLNIGSGNKNTGIILYALAGPVFDVNLSAQLNDLDVKDRYESLDVGILAGGGIEISRFLLEGRYTWGLTNLLVNNSNAFSSDAKSRTFALLAGLRFN